MFSSRDLVLDMFEYLDLSTSMVKFYPEVSQLKSKKDPTAHCPLQWEKTSKIRLQLSRPC